MEYIELNWLCKHIKKIRSSQPTILVLNWIKHGFSLWVSFKSSSKNQLLWKFRSSHPEVFLRKGTLKICRIYGRTPMPKRDFKSNFIEIALWHGCSPVNLLHIFRAPLPNNTSGRLLLKIAAQAIWAAQAFGTGDLFTIFLQKQSVGGVLLKRCS